MAYRKFSREQAAAHRTENIEAAQQILTEQVSAIRNSDDWRGYLTFQSRLHGYSANNVMLIFAQHEELYRKGLVTEPHPTWVASYRTWQQLGRQVDKGQHGLAIYAPMRSVIREAVDGDGTRRRLERGEDPNGAKTRTRAKHWSAAPGCAASPSRRCSRKRKRPATHCRYRRAHNFSPGKRRSGWGRRYWR